MYSNRLGHKEEARTGIQRISGSEDMPSKTVLQLKEKKKKKDKKRKKRHILAIER